MSQRDLEIQTGAGDTSALLTRPRGAKALLVLGHGAGAGMRHAFLEAVAQRLAARDVATLRYQFPYMEAGRKAPNTPKVLVATVRAAVAAGIEAAAGLPLFAGGKSLGGRMTSTAAAEEPLPAVRGIVFFGFPLHAPSQPSRHRAAHLSDVHVPMLFLQGTRDKLADLELLAPVCKDLSPRATLHVVEGGDHSFHVLKRSGRTDDEALDEICQVSADWMLEHR
jgi:predicted alpha/beta-hydrolase family hydrolase